MNQTMVTEFFVKGLSEAHHLQPLFFLFFLSLYTVALTGNILVFVTISFNPTLHPPMYFFLVNLAVVDIMCTSTILPKVLENLAGRKTIFCEGCMPQLYFFTWSLGAELLLFTAMAYDRYVAICHPLHYSTMMSKRVCMLLAAGVWSIRILTTSINTSLMVQLSFCHSNVVNHFFCEIPALLKLSCRPTYLNETMAFTANVFLAVGNFMITMLSCAFSTSSILKIRTTEGKKRAFSTCSSHLIVVSMYYSTVIYTYIRPSSSFSLDKDKVVSVIYTSVPSTLKTLIYTLRNKEVKVGLKNVFSFFQRC
ncbi:LOW QUALITY PROTEIN: olfactory receptor 13G1-like [Vombatus ursinus]|uniref:LOW QUALITY PROTEIN: olfactory receptor 13G1-like n=1 Tax=Vombatus ursinus TaxID=29139 RepID=UPI000FFD64DD|nr:LOW QUALITY PROTEIN: olfactory receptor 13G1-like [Vombatus ursinus]